MDGPDRLAGDGCPCDSPAHNYINKLERGLQNLCPREPQMALIGGLFPQVTFSASDNWWRSFLLIPYCIGVDAKLAPERTRSHFHDFHSSLATLDSKLLPPRSKLAFVLTFCTSYPCDHPPRILRNRGFNCQRMMNTIKLSPIILSLLMLLTHSLLPVTLVM